jgi:hypothetical protein
VAVGWCSRVSFFSRKAAECEIMKASDFVEMPERLVVPGLRLKWVVDVVALVNAVSVQSSVQLW